MAHVAVTIPNVLSIAGTDPTGGAGIQADLKSIAAAGGYGMCVVTSLVAQNTQGVREIHTPPQAFLRAQLAAVFDDVAVDAVKIGMLGDAETTATVSEFLAGQDVPVVVVDPVMVATSGDRLLTADAEEALRQFVRDHATVVTPNIPELAVLTGNAEAADFDAAIEQGRAFAAESGVAVVVKGGHLDSGMASNALVGPDGSVEIAEVPRVDTKNTHGTGCSLSSALAARLAVDGDAGAALRWTSAWLHEAIAHADELNVGKGHGPVHHFHRLYRLAGEGA
ncbi:bifunctional hydroxymethylpyrimidine kinase/phosphomethylpyrimidine kinase [Corynebacterium aquatimens]|nr:bifunctional hydroxymethylpyrimidine kinase/phosphomethylpyrimidine kinase [Corynebacterium aquatimens]UIZ92474.1 bifunctional hydroxymethylpyrimidine kinase/phosphomethylpyrimidine kinase [Corynebacterium sp. CNCTC7651]